MKKYRAWDKVKKQWIPGAYGFHILGEAMLYGGLFSEYSAEDLDNIILTEYTGLKDCKRTKEYPNGQEIYEGDIVEYTIVDEDSCCGRTYKERFLVEWNERKCSFQINDGQYHVLGTHQGIYPMSHLGSGVEAIEVVGNKFETEREI